MSESKCPFSIIQTADTCRCHHAHEVVRRGGSEFDCREPAAHAVCTALTRHLNRVALPVLGYEDDLTQTPKSVYQRVLLGGLQGLRMAENPENGAPETPDIWTVVAATQARYPSLDGIPACDFVPTIQASTIKKRQRKKS